MKRAATIAALALAGCGQGPAAPPTPDEREYVQCSGKFTEATRQTVVIQCDDGRAYSFTAHRFGLGKEKLK